jgi:hypothetical protein
MGLCTVPIDAAYEPMYAGAAAEVATESNRAVWLYGRLIDHKVTTVSDLADRRLLILGDPGTVMWHLQVTPRPGGRNNQAPASFESPTVARSVAPDRPSRRSPRTPYRRFGRVRGVCFGRRSGSDASALSDSECVAPVAGVCTVKSWNCLAVAHGRVRPAE